MRRRDFITLLGGAAAAWPLAALAQQPERVRRIGVLMASPVTDARYQSLVAVFRQRLHELGWDERFNIQIEYRWAAEDAESIRAYARELVGLRPDVILARSSPEIAALRDETHTIRSCSHMRLIRSPVASSPTSRIRAAISPGL